MENKYSSEWWKANANAMTDVTADETFCSYLVTKSLESEWRIGTAKSNGQLLLAVYGPEQCENIIKTYRFAKELGDKFYDQEPTSLRIRKGKYLPKH